MFCILIAVVSKLIQEYVLNGYSLLYTNYTVITWVKWGEDIILYLVEWAYETHFPKE